MKWIWIFLMFGILPAFGNEACIEALNGINVPLGMKAARINTHLVFLRDELEQYAQPRTLTVHSVTGSLEELFQMTLATEGLNQIDAKPPYLFISREKDELTLRLTAGNSQKILDLLTQPRYLCEIDYLTVDAPASASSDIHERFFDLYLGNDIHKAPSVFTPRASHILSKYDEGGGHFPFDLNFRVSADQLSRLSLLVTTYAHGSGAPGHTASGAPNNLRYIINTKESGIYVSLDTLDGLHDFRDYLVRFWPSYLPPLHLVEIRH